MASDSTQIRFSLKSKLLISTICSLVMLIAFLNLSSIVLFKEDKRAYIYSAQATEASLAGKDFVQIVKHALDTLKVAMGSLDPARPVSEQQRASLQAMLDNQSEILFLKVAILNPVSDKLKTIAQFSKKTKKEEPGLEPSHFDIPTQDLPGLVSELNEQSYSILNFSRLDSPPLVGVVLGDLGAKTSEGFVVALGVLSLKEFLKGLSERNLTLATLSGRVIYDSDPALLYYKKDISQDPLFNLAVTNKTSSGATEFERNGSRYLGTYLRPGLDVAVMTKTEWKDAMRATFILGEKFVLLGIMAISAAVIYALLFARTLTTPLQLLFQGTKEIERGNFALDLEIKSRDEIGALTGSFNSMSRKISELMEEFRKKVLLEQEVAIASTVQQTLIPASLFENDRFRIRSHYQSATDCGGDWWGLFHAHDKLCLMISDATGHGLPSALITAAARGYFSVMSRLANEDPDFSFSPSAMMSFANQVVYEASLGKIQMTFFIGVVDLNEMTITYSSAGHTPAWLFMHNNGAFSQKSLVANGCRLGERAELPPLEEKTVKISPEDILVLYTDGVLEGTNKDGVMFGKKRFKGAIDESVAKGPDAIIENIMKNFLDYHDGKALDDDVTLVAVKFLAPSGNRGTDGANDG